MVIKCTSDAFENGAKNMELAAFIVDQFSKFLKINIVSHAMHMAIPPVKNK